MSRRFVCTVVIVVSVLSLLLAGCQAPPPASTNPPSEASIEQMKAEAIEQELSTFDMYINRDWDALDAVTDPNFYQIGNDGAYIERDAALAGIADEKLVVHKA